MPTISLAMAAKSPMVETRNRGGCEALSCPPCSSPDTPFSPSLACGAGWEGSNQGGSEKGVGGEGVGEGEGEGEGERERNCASERMSVSCGVECVLCLYDFRKSLAEE